MAGHSIGDAAAAAAMLQGERVRAGVNLDGNFFVPLAGAGNEATASAGGVATVMHVQCPDRLPEELYRQVLEQLADLSPVVQALPPSPALAELRGALRYHGTGTHRLGEMLRVRISASTSGSESARHAMQELGITLPL